MEKRIILLHYKNDFPYNQGLMWYPCGMCDRGLVTLPPLAAREILVSAIYHVGGEWYEGKEKAAL
jgi:hypothetical protein